MYKKELADFFTFLLQKGLNKSTIDRKMQAISFLRKNKGLTPKRAQTILMTLYQEGRAGGYLNILIGTLKNYGEFKKIKGFDIFPLFKNTPRLKSTLSDEEIEDFLSLPPIKVHNQYYYEKAGYDMWTLFFQIMAFSGMRTSEVANLTPNDIDFGRHIFILEQTKTDPRFVPIAPILEEPIKEYLKVLKGNKLFPTANKATWLYQFRKRIDRLGIKRNNLTPYSLRHSFITRLLEQDINLFKVQKIVGHKKADTTAQYTHLTTKDIVKTIQKDPLGMKNVNPREIIKRYIEVIADLGAQNDSRFSYMLTQKESSLLFKLKIKLQLKPQPALVK